MKQAKQRVAVLHPILFALYPPLALLARNILQIRPEDAVRSILVFLVFGAAVFLLCQWIFKDWLKAGLVASLLILSFASYGQVYSALEVSPTFASTLGRHRFLAPLWLILTALLIWLVARRKTISVQFNSVLNAFAIILILMPLINLTVNAWQTDRNASLNQTSVEKISQSANLKENVRPDVYYIILDMYARDDILQERYDYDNSEFLKELEEMGFYVARCSVSNYNMTELSMASSFNMNYLDQLGAQYTAGQTDRTGLLSLIQHSAVRQIFEGMGYKFINYETGFTFTEIRDADLFLQPSPQDYPDQDGGIRLNAFEVMLVKTTGLVLISDAQAKWANPMNSALDTRKEHIARETYLLRTLPTLAKGVPGPKFVYAHILIPHPPFVFSKEGVNLSFPGNDGATEYGPTRKDFAVGYRNQLDYIDETLIPILKQIIADSPTPPIILVQGDHGVDPKRSFNLSAYYFPGEARESLYPSISPVNSFRLIFNEYFGGSYDLLPDINYASSDKLPFDFKEIVNKRNCP